MSEMLFLVKMNLLHQKCFSLRFVIIPQLLFTPVHQILWWQSFFNIFFSCTFVSFHVSQGKIPVVHAVYIVFYSHSLFLSTYMVFLLFHLADAWGWFWKWPLTIHKNPASMNRLCFSLPLVNNGCHDFHMTEYWHLLATRVVRWCTKEVEGWHAAVHSMAHLSHFLQILPRERVKAT